MDQINCIETRHSIAALVAMGPSLNPRNIVGIAVVGDTVHLQTLEFPARVAEKMSMPIPAMQIDVNATVTAIKSVQLSKGLMVVEIVGDMTETVKAVIRVITAQLFTKGMITGFFPCGTAKLPTTYYFGFGVEILREANPGAKNIRLLNNGNGLIFTEGVNLRQVGLSQINGDWLHDSIIVHTARKNIVFLGRVQHDNTVVLTLADETTFLATLSRTQATVVVLTAFRQKISAVFGYLQEQAGVSYLAGLKGQELVLIPVNN